MEFVRSTLVLSLFSLVTPCVRAQSSEVRSGNGRFLARIRPPAEIEVVDVSDAMKPSWSARGLALAPANTWRLTDDGHAVVGIAGANDVTQEQKRPLVQVVRDGSLLVSAGAEALGLRAGNTGSWLLCDRLREIDKGGERGIRLDLLASDERVRTIDLETGAVRLPHEEAPSGPVRVEPLAPDGTEPAFVGEWFAPEVAFSGVAFPVHVRGGMPNPAWRFAGFSLERGSGTDLALVLTPRATPPIAGTISPQVLKGYEGSASLLGLQPGLVSIEVRGRGEPERGRDDGPRPLRVLADGTIAWFEKSGGIAGIRESVALFEDGRLETSGSRTSASGGAPRRLVLASDEQRATIARALAKLPSDPRARPRTPGADFFEYELAWTADGHPVRALRDEKNLEPELRSFAEAMAALVPVQDERRSYRIDSIRSLLEVKTGSGGLLSAFGHDHRLMVQRLGGEVELDPADLQRSSVTVTLEAGSLAVVDDESQEDRAEIEKEMNRKVLEVAKFPEIVFRSRTVEVRSGEEDVFEITVEGELALHGVARTIRVPVHLETRGESLRATGKLRVKQSDFGISRTSAVGGTVKVADEVDISIDITAVR